ncbi:MAG TPA: ABC transporter substrate-binding protein [Candidatus Pelethocola excrementipullorum]|nr:ABC transporter substrate-binding protein [Candidatus Pelethocola excrementipullorum]
MLKSNKRKLVSALLLALVLLMSTLAGCGNTAEEPKSTAQSADSTSTSEQKSDSQQESTDSKSSSEGETREITDMAGRTVTIPSTINKVFSTDPITAIYLYTTSPDKLLGWNYELNKSERKYVLPEYQDIPSFGMGDSVNYEAVIEAQPDIALTVTKINDASIADADKLSERLGVPVVMVNNDMKAAPEVYRFLGDLLSVEDHAEALAGYAEKTFADIEAANIPEDKKVTVYYGNGKDSLETAPKGSGHAQILDLVGAINVADLESEDGSRIQVSLEQVLAWNPQYIVVNGEAKQDLTGNDAAESLKSNPDFADIQAVQDGNVFGAPKAPFSWVDRPTGPNRIIGLRWLAAKLYPEYYTYDIDEEVKEYYDLFYHMELTEEQLQELYND